MSTKVYFVLLGFFSMLCQEFVFSVYLIRFHFHIIRENPPRQVISISPTYNYALVRPPQPCLDPTSGYHYFAM